ncbi:hypothetical protein [Bdellovibrio sp. ArHS]|uniref:hypothetical protein n=1 Tax=Bdellovibrio sp. ArHS TaxID=1569284 RepID=UPI000A58D891|nr:hypothetical protein [Bdellovibrio sp. ArHS]
MRIFHALSWTCATLIISSCGELTSSITTSETWIPESFFYKTLGSCEQGTLGFPVLIGGGTQLWTDPAQVRVGQIELYLQKNGTYSARYREFDFTTQLFEKNFQSTYSLDHRRKEIYLAGLGVAKVLQTGRGRSYMHLLYSENYNSTLLAGSTGDLYLYKGQKGVGETAADRCGW